MNKILFICTGNTCRSPMAAALFNRLAAQGSRVRSFSASSAGLSAVEGEAASANAILAMKDYGCDLSAHRAHELYPADIQEAFLILTMSISHKQYIYSRFSGAYRNVYTLKEYVYGIPEDIKDPFGGSLQVYRQCAKELAEAVEALFEKVKKS